MNEQILKNLNNPEKIEEFKNTIDDIVVFDSVGDAQKVFVELGNLFSKYPDFEKADSFLFSTYQKFYTALKYVILFDLPNKEIFDLITNHLDFIFKYPEYDFERKIKYKISSIDNLESRDDFKNKVRLALLNNKMPFGQGKIMVSGIKQDATISAWLKDCYTKLGVETIDALKINQYLVNDPNTKNLSAAEKINLKTLLNLFEKMKISSKQLPLHEESFVAVLPNNEIATVIGGQPEKLNMDLAKSMEKITDNSASGINVDVKAPFQDDDLFLDKKPVAKAQTPVAPKPLSPLEDLEQSLNNYSESSFEYKALLQEINRLKKIELKKSLKTDVKK